MVVLGAAHPLRMREALRPFAGSAQRRASRYALRTFQIPRRAENLLARDDRWVRELYRTWTGPRWRGTPSFNADVGRYAEAMRIHLVGYGAAEHFRWAWRSRWRSDGRRFNQSLSALIDVPVLQLHGDFDTCVLPATAQGSGRYVTADYEWRVLDGVGHFPHDEVPDLVSGELIRWAKR
jgi:pimeloyl-ACP methyl ester carboxylesterase